MKSIYTGSSCRLWFVICQSAFPRTCLQDPFLQHMFNFPISRSFQAFTISMPNDLWRAARPSIRPSLLAGNLQLPSHVNEGLELECEPCLPCKTVLLTSRVSGALWALISGPQQLVNLLAASCFMLSCYLLHPCLLQSHFEHLWSSWSTLSCHHLNTFQIPEG